MLPNGPIPFAKGHFNVSKKTKKSVKRSVKAGKGAVRIAALTAVAMAAYPIAMKLVNEDDD